MTRVARTRNVIPTLLPAWDNGAEMVRSILGETIILELLWPVNGLAHRRADARVVEPSVMQGVDQPVINTRWLFVPLSLTGKDPITYVVGHHRQGDRRVRTFRASLMEARQEGVRNDQREALDGRILNRQR